MKQRRIVKVLSGVVVTLSMVVALLPSPALAVQDPGITLPDDKTGHQIQLVYVETSSAAGSNYDTSGQIAAWVDQLQAWLQKQIGKELIFDTYQGKIDIAYLKFNGNLSYEGNGHKELIQMYRKLNPNTYHGKTLAFVIDQVRPVGETLCGWGGPNEGYGLIFPNLTFSDGSECIGYDSTTKINSGFSFPAKSLLHEIIHSYGVEGHVCVDTTDLMHGSPECEEAGVVQDSQKPVTFDLSERFYFGGNRTGVDLRTLRIWSDGSGLRRPDLDQGICWVGQRCVLSETTFPVQGTVQLQLKSGKKWIVVNSVRGVIANCKGCFKYLFENSYSFQKSGNFQYRIFSPADKKYRAYVGPTKVIKVLD
jgi:hypothetical protein